MALSGASRQKQFPIAALCLLAIWVPLLHAQDIIRLPGILPDTDKYSKDQGNDAFAWGYFTYPVDGSDPTWHVVPNQWALSIPQDSLPNRVLDPGENWGEIIDDVAGEWRILHDRSCWAATANNLYRYAMGVGKYHTWMYDEGLDTTWSSSAGSFWFSGGDFPTAALDIEDVAWHDNWSYLLYSGYYFENPESWVEAELARGKPVAASVVWSPYVGSVENGHAFTVYGIDRPGRRLWITDSDSDLNGDEPHWINFDWVEDSAGLGGALKIDWYGDGTWSVIRGFDALESRVWATPAGGIWGGNHWFNAPSGTKVSEISGYHRDEEPLTVRVTQPGHTANCLIMGFRNRATSPTSLIVEPAGQFTVQRYLMRDTALDISGHFHGVDQQALDGGIVLRPGGIWQGTGPTIVGAQGQTTAEQLGGFAMMRSLILGHDAGSRGQYWLMNGTLGYTDLVIGDKGRGELGISSGAQLLHNTQTGLPNDLDTCRITLGRADTGYGNLVMLPGTDLRPFDMTVGQRGSGLFDQRGGSVTVRDALVLGDVRWRAIEAAGNNPAVYGYGNGTYLLTNDAELRTDSTVIGNMGTGLFDHSGSAIHDTGALAIGRQAFDAQRSSGTYSFTGGQLRADTVVVGSTGDGRYIQSGGLADVGMLAAGQGGGSGEVSVSGGGLLVREVMTIGNGQLALTGSSSVIVGGSAMMGQLVTHADQARLVAGRLTMDGMSGIASYYHFGDGSLVVNGHESFGEEGKVHFIQHDGEHNVLNTIWLAGHESTYVLEDGLLRADKAMVGNSGFASIEHSGGSATFLESLRLGSPELTGYGQYQLSQGQHSSPSEMAADYLTVGSTGQGDFLQSGGTARINSLVTIGASERPAGGSMLHVAAGMFDARNAEIKVGPGHEGLLKIGSAGGTELATIIADDLVIGEFGSVTAQGDASRNMLRLNTLSSPHHWVTLPNATLQLGHPGGAGHGVMTLGKPTTFADFAIGYDANAVVTVSSGGSLKVNELLLGQTSSAVGRLDIAAASDNRVGGDMVVGSLGTGEVDHPAGRLVIDGSLVLGQSEGSEGSFIARTVIDQASIGMQAGALVVGVSGGGDFSQRRGYVNIQDFITVGNLPTASGVLIMSGGRLKAGGDLVIANYGNGQYAQNGGNVEVSTELVVGAGPTGVGTLSLSAGTLSAESVSVGRFGRGTYTQSDGVLTAASVFAVSPGGNHAAEANLNGGTLEAMRLEVGTDDGIGRFYWRGGAVSVEDIIIGNHGVLSVGEGLQGGGVWILPSSLELNGILNAPYDTLVFNTPWGQVMNRPGCALSAGGIRLGSSELTAEFTQNAGLANIGMLEIGTQDLGAGRYRLQGGSLIAGQLHVGGHATMTSRFEFTGGTLQTNQITLHTNGVMTTANDWIYGGSLSVAGGDLLMAERSLTLSNATQDFNNRPLLSISAGEMHAAHLAITPLTDLIQTGGHASIGRVTINSAEALMQDGSLDVGELIVAMGSQIQGPWTTGRFSQTGGVTNAVDLLVANYPNTWGRVSLGGTGVLNTINTRLGIAGEAEFKQTGGKHMVSGTLSVGESWAAGDGKNAYTLSEGELLTHRSCIGTLGWAEFRQGGGLHQVATSLDIGPQGVDLGHQAIGEYYLKSGRLETPAIHIEGHIGSRSWGSFELSGGELQAGSIRIGQSGGLYVTTDRTLTEVSVDLFNGGYVEHTGRLTMLNSAVSLDNGEWFGDVLRLESSRGKTATFIGSGLVEVTGQLHHGGRVIADGSAQGLVLDLTEVAAVTGPANNTGHWGWYARNQGVLQMPRVAIGGNGVYTVGDDALADHLTLINSVRMNLSGIKVGGEVLISLMADDCPDIPKINVPLLGVWDFDLSDGFRIGSVVLIFRYDDLQLSRLQLGAEDLRVFRFDGRRWQDVTGTLDTQNYCISSTSADSFSLYALGALPPPQGSYSAWAASHGVTGTISDDDDNDGVPNGIEFFMGDDSSSFTAMPAPGETNPITWNKGAGYTGTYGTDYMIETSTDLETWTPVPAGDIGFSGNDISHTLPPGEVKVFARLKVMGPQ